MAVINIVIESKKKLPGEREREREHMFTVFVMSVVLLFHFTFMLYSMTSFE